MKRYLLGIVFLGCLLPGTQSCEDYLDLVPDAVPSIETVFENRSGAERFLFTLYSRIPNLNSYAANPALMSGDEGWVNDIAYPTLNLEPADIARGQQSVGAIRVNRWEELYIGIRDCNVFLEEIGVPQDITEVEREQWMAEAKVLKAYFHFFLLRMYGPVPAIRKNLPVDTDPASVRVERAPFDEVTDYIVALIDEALPDLPAFTTNLNTNYGRINKPIAAAIKAKTLVQAASPLFNGNPDFAGVSNNSRTVLFNPTFDATKWERAATACKEAIDLAEAAGNRLFEFQDSFVATDELSDTTVLKMSIRASIKASNLNSEVIWAATGQPFINQNWAMARVDPGGFGTNTLNNGVQSYFSPTLRIAEMFYTENGVPLDEDRNYDFGNRYATSVVDEDHFYYVLPGFTTANLHLHREARFYASLGFDGNRWYGVGETNDENTLTVMAKSGEPAGIQDGQNGFSATGYFAKKLVDYRTGFIIQPGVFAGLDPVNYPWPLIRLADLYLLYAEALNEVKGAPDGEVYEWIDRVRNRAGLEGVVSSWSSHSTQPSKPATKEGMRDIIHRERMIELVFEGQRFWDLRRWKRAIEFMNSPIRGWNVTAESTAEYYTLQTLFQQSFIVRDYLWPIGLSTLLNNQNLVQNPGW